MSSLSLLIFWRLVYCFIALRDDLTLLRLLKLRSVSSATDFRALQSTKERNKRAHTLYQGGLDASIHQLPRETILSRWHPERTSLPLAVCTVSDVATLQIELTVNFETFLSYAVNLFSVWFRWCTFAFARHLWSLFVSIHLCVTKGSAVTQRLLTERLPSGWSDQPIELLGRLLRFHH